MHPEKLCWSWWGYEDEPFFLSHLLRRWEIALLKGQLMILKAMQILRAVKRWIHDVPCCEAKLREARLLGVSTC